MRTTAKIRVSRTELIKVVDGRLRKLEAENKRQKEAHPQKMEEWRERCAALLDAKAKAAREGKFQPQYNRIELPDQPAAPNSYRERCNLERTLKTLKIGTEDSILLSPDDADYYFGPCSTKP